MPRRPAVRAVVAVLAVLVCLAPAGCGGLRLGPSDAEGGALAGVATLDGASYVVAGGTTTEVRVLCQLTIAALQAAGAQASDQCGKVGAVDVRRPAQQTEVDTGWVYLGAPDRDGGERYPAPSAVPPASRDTVPTPAAGAAADAALGVTRLTPTAFGDTDAVVVSPSTPGVATISALATRLGVTGRPLCATTGSAGDPARLPALLATYGSPVPVRIADEGAVFAGVATGSCVAGVVPGTSGRIPALGLTALADDRGALTRGPAGRGGAVPVLRTDVFAAHPQVAQVLGLLAVRLDDTAIRSINREVDQDGVDPRDAARRWLLAQGLIART